MYLKTSNSSILSILGQLMFGKETGNMWNNYSIMEQQFVPLCILLMPSKPSIQIFVKSQKKAHSQMNWPYLNYYICAFLNLMENGMEVKLETSQWL